MQMYTDARASADVGSSSRICCHRPSALFHAFFFKAVRAVSVPSCITGDHHVGCLPACGSAGHRAFRSSSRNSAGRCQQTLKSPLVQGFVAPSHREPSALEPDVLSNTFLIPGGARFPGQFLMPQDGSRHPHSPATATPYQSECQHVRMASAGQGRCAEPACTGCVHLCGSDRRQVGRVIASQTAPASAGADEAGRGCAVAVQFTGGVRCPDADGGAGGLCRVTLSSRTGADGVPGIGQRPGG